MIPMGSSDPWIGCVPKGTWEGLLAGLALSWRCPSKREGTFEMSPPQLDLPGGLVEKLLFNTTFWISPQDEESVDLELLPSFVDS